MRKRNRKFNLVVVGVLLCTATCAISPISIHAANGWDIALDNSGQSLSQSSVSITINGSGNEVLNADRGVAQGIIKRTASVAFGATDGYRVTVSGNPNLTGTNTKKTIPSAALTLSNMVNQWGWYAVNGSADCSASNVYKTLSTTGTQIDNGALAANTTKTYTMCFGVRIDSNQAADSYSGSVTISAVAEPHTVATTGFSGITYMQDMTPNICTLAKENETAQLVDRRDSKKYWVTKLKDGNCWMSQNLDFDITISGSGTSMTSNVVASTSDVDEDWGGKSTYKPRAPYTSMGQGGQGMSNTGSWDVGEYVINQPKYEGDSCGSQITNLSSCTMFTNVSGWATSSDPNFYKNNGNSPINSTSRVYDAHYLYGNLYQFNAATAGTGYATEANSDAPSSVCPKGWKLPTSSTDTGIVKNSYAYLLQQYGLSSYMTGSASGISYDIALSPLFYVQAGSISPQMTYYASGIGKEIRLRSKKVHTTNTRDYYLYAVFSGTYNKPVYPSREGVFYSGESLRCLVPTA